MLTYLSLRRAGYRMLVAASAVRSLHLTVLSPQQATALSFLSDLQNFWGLFRKN